MPQGHTRNIFSVKWSPVSDQRLLSAAGDGEVRVFDLDRAAGKGRQVRRGRHSWHEWPDGDGPLFKTLRCHTDRVKRIATDGSNDIFLTAGEDGHVFQHDLRVPHTCRADGQGCGPPLVDYPGMSLFTLTISRAAPWMFVVGGTSPFVYLRASHPPTHVARFCAQRCPADSPPFRRPADDAFGHFA